MRVQVTAVRWLADQRGPISASALMQRCASCASATSPIDETQKTSSAGWDAPVALLHALGFLVTEEAAAAAAAVAATTIACTGESAVGAATVTEALRARGGGAAASHNCCEREPAA